MDIKNEDYYNLFTRNPTGIKVLEDMKAAHHCNGTEFDPDPRVHAFRSGERNVVLRILTILKDYEEEIKNG